MLMLKQVSTEAGVDVVSTEAEMGLRSADVGVDLVSTEAGVDVVSTEAGMGLRSADVGVDLVSTEADMGPS